LRQIKFPGRTNGSVKELKACFVARDRGARRFQIRDGFGLRDSCSPSNRTGIRKRLRTSAFPKATTTSLLNHTIGTMNRRRYRDEIVNASSLASCGVSVVMSRSCLMSSQRWRCANAQIVATGTAKGECNMTKCTITRRLQLALVPRREYRKPGSAHPIQVSHP
jgi:hypothetical protein